MKVLQSFLIVLGLVLVALIIAQIPGGKMLLGGILPSVAFLVFIVGFIVGILKWAKIPVPFRIPTTCGQEKSLPWIKHDELESPSSKAGVIGRMLLEIFFFRTLFRNTKADVYEGPKLAYGSSKYLWLFGLLFHYSFLLIVLRHMRLFTNPIPGFVSALEFGDGFFQVGAPVLYQTDLIFLLAVTFLFLRRVVRPQMRYISLVNDYFPLFLIFGIGLSGVLMRYFLRVDVVNIKQLAVSIATNPFAPVMAGNIGDVFFVHVFLVSILMVYFPFSKLMHMGGIFMSPTRNMINNSRAVRHINPWNDPNIKPHSYADYEDDFREFMKDGDIPVEKE